MLIVAKFFVIVFSAQGKSLIPFGDSDSACKFLLGQLDPVAIFELKADTSYKERKCAAPIFIDPPKPDAYFTYPLEKEVQQ